MFTRQNSSPMCKANACVSTIICDHVLVV